MTWIRTVPYSRDNSLNAFGDFTELRTILFDNVMGYFLVGPVVSRELTKEEFSDCCINFFYQSAKEKP